MQVREFLTLKVEAHPGDEPWRGGIGNVIDLNVIGIIKLD